MAAPARKTAPRKVAAKKSKSASPPAAKQAGAQGLLRAGLKALGNVHNDVVKRQTNVIESLLGMAPSSSKGKPGDAAAGKPPARGFAGLDSFGIRKFEDVFDQRVATALQRLGMPSAQEINELREQMRLLREHLERIETSRRKR